MVGVGSMSTMRVDTIEEKTSGNGVKIPGHVVQCVPANGNNTQYSNANAWGNTQVINSITPKYSTSTILGQATVAVWRSGTNAYYGVRVENTGGNTGIKAIYGDGYIQASGEPLSWQSSYEFTYTAGTTSAVQSMFQIHPAGGSLWFPNNAGTYSPTHRWSFTLWEIAQ